MLLGLFQLLHLLVMFSHWFLTLPPLRWLLGSFAFFPFGYIVWVRSSCSSQLIIPYQSCSPGCARAGSCPGPSKETPGWRDRQGWMLTFFFLPPNKLIQHCEKSLQIRLHWKVNSLLDCEIKHFCHVFLLWALPWVVYILALHIV